MKMGFISQDLMAEDVDTKNLNKPEDDEDNEDDYLPPLETEANTIEHLPPGYKFNVYDPTYPNARADNYRREMFKNVSAAFGLDYATLMGDLEKTNYSSLRHGAIESQDRYRKMQAQLEKEVCRKIFMHLLNEAVSSGALRFNNRSTYEEALSRRYQHYSYDP